MLRRSRVRGCAAACPCTSNLPIKQIDDVFTQQVGGPRYLSAPVVTARGPLGDVSREAWADGYVRGRGDDLSKPKLAAERRLVKRRERRSTTQALLYLRYPLHQTARARQQKKRWRGSFCYCRA
jgi:hypothetical protein